jgi:hypothetical protein
MNDIELASLAEFIERDAMMDFYACAPAPLATQWGVKVVRFDSAALLLVPALKAILLNRVFALGLAEPVTESMLEAMLRTFREAGAAKFAVQLTPAARPGALREWLGARGLRHDDNWSRAMRGVEPPPALPTDLRLEQIDEKHAPAFGEIICRAFGFPLEMGVWVAATVGRRGWRHYCAFDGDKPVATGALFVRGEVGWLGFGATLPEYRRRGAQGAIMAQRIRDGGALGCRWLVTETGEDTPQHPNPSFHNMLRTGFQLAYPRANYIP